MTEAVGNISNEVQLLTFLTSKKTINCLDDSMDDVDVLPLVEATDIVSLCNLAVVEDSVNSTSVINNIEPVANVLTLTIDREWFTVANVVNKTMESASLETGKDRSCSNSWSQWLACRMYHGMHERSDQKMLLMQNMDYEGCTL
jgi:hypothetical protein